MADLGDLNLTDPVPADSVSVADSGTFYTATDVEGVLAEIAPQLGGGGAMVELFDSTLGSDASTIDTDPTDLSGYANLRIIVQARSTRASNTIDFFHLRFNNDSGNNYDTNYFQGGGSSWNLNEADAGSAVGHDPATASPFATPAADSPAGAAAHYEIVIPNYAATVFRKTLAVNGITILAEDDHRHWGGAGQWRSTAAITRITLTMVNGNFLTGSRMMVYGF
jgi:hypothetical protein